MMGRQTNDQSQLFYLFNLERCIPAGHLLRRINPIVTQVLAVLREKLAPFHSEIGRPSIDPELMLRMLIVGYCYGIRFERRLCRRIDCSTSSSNPILEGPWCRFRREARARERHRNRSGG
jgi:transposase